MDLRGVAVKKVVWSAAKLDKDGEEKDPPSVAITLEISDPESAMVRQLLDFAQRGSTTWSINSLQAEFSAKVG